MREVNATEAKARLAELLRSVEFGEAVAITRHGRTVAHLSPPGTSGDNARKTAVERLRAWRRRRPPVGLTTAEILAAMHEGRRW